VKGVKHLTEKLLLAPVKKYRQKARQTY